MIRVSIFQFLLNHLVEYASFVPDNPSTFCFSLLSVNNFIPASLSNYKQGLLNSLFKSTENG